MASSSRGGGIEMDVMIGRGRSSPKPSDDAPFRVLVLGPFSNGNRTTKGFRPIRVDVTEIDDLIARLSPTVSLDMADGTLVDLSFEELDDFHPDALYDRLSVFKAMRQLRRELQDPSTFERAAAQVRGAGGPRSVEASSGEASPGEASPEGEADNDMMARLLGKAPTAAAQAPTASGVDAFVRKLVAPHVVQGPRPELSVHLSALDLATAEMMRAILHHPKFQALESVWRGLDFLLRGIEGNMDVAVLDLSRADLDAELSADDPRLTSLAKCLIGEAGASEPPWALAVGAFTFGPSPQDASTMQALARVLARAGVPFVSAADPSLVSQSPPQGWTAWTALRTAPEATMVGLALPRFMLRLPYGKRTDEIDRFDFEEQTDPPEPERFSWGNPAFLIASLLGRSFAKAGWGFSPADTLSVQGLPTTTYSDGGEPAQTPCAEVWMSQASAETWLAQGIMPLASVRGRDAVRLLRVQSIADPPAALAGRWR